MLKYYLKDGSREKGPFLLDDLKYQRIRPSTLVKIDNGEWKPIREIPDLSFLLKLDDHSHGSSSYAKPDEHAAYGNPAAQAKNRARIAIVIGVALALMAMGMSMFFFVNSSQ